MNVLSILMDDIWPFFVFEVNLITEDDQQNNMNNVSWSFLLGFQSLMSIQKHFEAAFVIFSSSCVLIQNIESFSYLLFDQDSCVS